jgi:hypothetical protein
VSWILYYKCPNTLCEASFIILQNSFFFKSKICLVLKFYYFFFFNSACPGQFTRTTTNPWTHWTPCKPSRQVKHRGGDRRALRLEPRWQRQENLAYANGQQASVQKVITIKVKGGSLKNIKTWTWFFFCNILLNVEIFFS